MSKSGSGRGRGWLNIKTTNQQNISPVISDSSSAEFTLKDLKDEIQFSDVVERTDLVNRIKQLSVYDDGIMLNQKLKYIIDSWKINCQTGEEVEQSFDSLYQSCLNDAELASKLVIMISSRTFITQEVHDQNIRLLFLRKLQNNFDNSKSLRKTNQIAFRNSVRVLGEFYSKARLANGQQLTFLATPLMSYLEMLLEDTQLPDLQLFATQLYLNGSTIKAELPEKFIELLNTIRMYLVSDTSLTKEGKLWLLLALEVANNRFGILPSDISKFYMDNLGDAAIASFQGTLNVLSVQTPQENKTLDNYQSNVSVLQLSSPIDSGNEQSLYSSDVSNTSQAAILNSSGSSSNNKEGKHGRPILGAGARLGKYKSDEESGESVKHNNSNWRDRDGTNLWNNRQKNDNWRDNKNSHHKHGTKSDNVKHNRGWEHDDRFDTNYS